MNIVWIFTFSLLAPSLALVLALILTMRTRDEFLSGIEYSCFAFAAAVSSHPAMMEWLRL
jgi:hypothetical protein